MTIIANLDAAIEQHYSETGTVSKELQIFGKVWTLEPVLTTAQLDPLMKVQAAAEIANDRSRGQSSSQEEQMAAIGMMGALPEIITMLVIQEQREEFRQTLRTKGIPLAVIPKVMEAIFVAYDAAPFTSEEPSSSVPQHPTNTPLLASTSDSGSSPDGAGQRSSHPSNPSPIDTHLRPPVPQAVLPTPVVQPVQPGLHTVPSPQEASQPYQQQIPSTVQ